jgi:large subunit ribosomal protein L10
LDADEAFEKSLPGETRQRLFILQGRRYFSLAFTKKEKGEKSAQYEQWLEKSEAVYVLTYTKMNMKEIDAFRAKARETGSEVHLVKNTLFTRALTAKGFPANAFLETTSLVGFAFSDVPGLAKVFADATKGNDQIKIKGGYIGKELLTDKQVKALADLPTLPVMRAMLLGVISAPASKLVRTLNEPARSMAAVVKAYSEKAGTAA